MCCHKCRAFEEPFWYENRYEVCSGLILKKRFFVIFAWLNNINVSDVGIFGTDTILIFILLLSFSARTDE